MYIHIHIANLKSYINMQNLSNMYHTLNRLCHLWVLLVYCLTIICPQISTGQLGKGQCTSKHYFCMYISAHVPLSVCNETSNFSSRQFTHANSLLFRMINLQSQPLTFKFILTTHPLLVTSNHIFPLPSNEASLMQDHFTSPKISAIQMHFTSQV